VEFGEVAARGAAKSVRSGNLVDGDTLAGVALDACIGRWRGSGLPTGHPLDGLLEAYPSGDASNYP
jgi:hypothetical protein